MAWIERRGKKYRVVWDTGMPENRKRRMQSFDTYAEAKQFKAKIELELSTGVYSEPSRMTFGEYLDHWLSLHGDKLAPKTLDSYQCEINNHIKPVLGNIKLAKLTPMHLQNYYDLMLKEGKAQVERQRIAAFQSDYEKALKKGDQKTINNAWDNLQRAKARLDNMLYNDTAGLSPTSVNYQHRIIHKALKQAVKWQMVSRNVADAVDPPRPAKKQIAYLKRNEVNRFINCIKQSPDYPIIATAILTGMRRGEILGLRWQDIDFEKGLIHVRQQLQYIQGKGYFFKTPKQHSIRDIPMPLPLNAIFRSIRKQQAEVKAIYEQAAKDSCKESQYTDLDLVFCRYDGRPLNPSGLTRRFQDLLEQHGFEPIRFHALRHTFATMARAAGVPIENLQDILGHADISTTKNLYTHVEIEPLREAVDKLTKYIDF